MKTKIDSLNIDAIREKALGNIFNMFSDLAEGALVVDHLANVLWANDKYLEFLGISDRACVVGKPIAELVETTKMPHVVQSGNSIPFDIIYVNQQWLVVSRFPIRDDDNVVIGGVCFVLFNDYAQLNPIFKRADCLREELKTTKSKLACARRAKYNFSQVIGSCAAILEVKRQAKRAAISDATVLLVGETGTGKELIAQATHVASSRSLQNFVAINVAAIPEELMEAEFFGAAPGAYTGAAPKGRVGKMALANGGTLFLDEIADMPMRMQVKLLRVLQEREVEQVGSNAVTKLDIRLIAATSKDLFQLVNEGKFRADLYYRLNVVPIAIPPLRERIDDIPLLVDALLNDVCASIGVPLKDIDKSAIDLLQRYSWPGNIRELRNILERACVFSSDMVLVAEDFASLLENGRASCSKLTSSVAEVEKSLIIDAIDKTHGNKTHAAKMLGISRSNLYKKLESYNLPAR